MKLATLRLLAAPLLLAQPAAGVAEGEDAVILQPASQWVMDYKDSSCALRRAFGDEQRRVVLELDDYTLQRNFRATVATAAFGGAHETAIVGFQPGEAKTATGLVRPRFVDGRTGIIFDLSLDPSDYDAKGTKAPVAESSEPSEAAQTARNAAVTGLFVGKAFGTDLILETGSMAAPMDALRKCDEDLERHLGLDPATLKAIAVGAKPIDQMKWARKVQEAYPTSALRAEESATVHFRLVVDAQGRVSDCFAQPEGQDPVFAKAACPILESVAKFDPARDAEGKPVPSIYVSRISWYLK
jgi:outer membrane biosynthesis protein TonB